MEGREPIFFLKGREEGGGEEEKTSPGEKGGPP